MGRIQFADRSASRGGHAFCRRERIEAFSKVSGEFCLNQSKTPDRKYLFVYSFYTQLKVIKGTTVLGDNMVLQGSEKHCNSCGATTRTKMGSRFVPLPDKTSDTKQTNKKPTTGLPHFILYFLQPFCTISSGALYNNASAF